jgi:hypothetical protein
MPHGKIDQHDATDKCYLGKDGTIFCGKLTVGCVRKRDGSIDYLSTSERKAHEEQVNFLMRGIGPQQENMLKQ